MVFFMKKSILMFLLVLTPLLANATSLYDRDQYVSLVSDRVAKRIGDNVTVLIYETTSASASANSDTQKEMAASVGVVDTTEPEQRALGIESSFNGGGDVNRSGNLLARITATVIDITDNGELVVKGSQHIEMNEDEQTISLEGRLRPEDIGPNNTVLSTRLSDAEIRYLAEGALADRQKPGWLTRFFNWIF